MKKIKYILILIIFAFVFPTMADAASSVSISVTCSNVTVGGSTTCTIRGTSNALSTVEADISISGGATMTGISAGSGFTPLENTASGTSGRLAYLTLDDRSGTFTIATINVQGVTAGAATLKITGVNVSTDGSTAKNSVGTKQATFTVSSPQTQPPATQPPQTQPTTRATTKATTKNPTTVATTNNQEPTTQPQTGAELVLSSVTVDDFEVTFQDGKYFATVNYDTESVEVKATASELITIIGQGTRNLAVGKNVVELVLKNELNLSTTVQVIITRPDDTNDYDTRLSSLRVVGYNLEFNKDTKEYTLTVPSTIKELYIIAESNNADVAITGAGLKVLENGENDIRVISQYGDKSSTEYVIHIKRSYNSVIMWVVMGILGTGLVGSVAFFMIDRKKLLANTAQEKNKILAEANRTAATVQENVPVNQDAKVAPAKTPVTAVSPIGATPVITPKSSFESPGAIPNVEAVLESQPKPAMVTPKPVVVPKPAAINQEVPQAKTQQVVETKTPTNPVAVAQSTVVPKVEMPKPNINNQPHQVKVVKTNPNPSQVKTINTMNTSNNYNNDQIVINTGK